MRAEYGQGFLNVPDDDERSVFQWLHIPAGGHEQIVLGNKLPLWYRAHWFQGRMQPCSGADCKMCAAGVGRQRRWVFSVVKWMEKRPYLWEVSDALAMEIRDICEQMDALVDVRLLVSREDGGPKARLKVRQNGMDEFHGGSAANFPEPTEALELTWVVMGCRSESSPEELSGSASAYAERGRKKSEY